MAAEGVVLLAGLGGIGKTALAVEAAHRMADRFPGGVLFVDLHGYDNARLSPEQALDALLAALGQEHPLTGFAAKQQRYRSLLAALPGPALIIPDNAATPDQVSALLPGDPRHLVLATSRHLLTDRVLTPRHLPVDVLPESVALLTELAGPSEHHSALADLCGHLPLALRIAAALLTERSPAELIADLTDAQERLTELDYGPDLAIRAAFDLSYRHLSAPEARLFALLGQNPGPDIGLPAAAALADCPERETARLLRLLARAHLVVIEQKRYRMHDLVRLYAAELPSDRAAFHRLLEHFKAYMLDTFRSGDHRSQAVIRWQDQEERNLLAVARSAAQEARYSDALLMLSAVHDVLLRHRRLTELVTISELAVETACRLDDPRFTSEAHYRLGFALAENGQCAEAEAALHRSLALDRERANQEHQVSVLVALSAVQLRLGRTESGRLHLREALRLGPTAVNDGTVVALVNASQLAVDTDPGLARQLCREACRVTAGRGDQAERMALRGLGRILLKLREFTAAVAPLQASVALSRELGEAYQEGVTVELLGRAFAELGDDTSALDCVRQAEALLRESDPDRAGTLRSLIAAVEGAAQGATGTR
ncbi:hypothetical protein ACFQ0T_11430 [Kitasatospora gansuensis]